MAQTNEGIRLSSVLNAFQIVEQIAKTGEVGVTDLASELDMHKSTVHTYLQTLADAGYLVQTGGKYRVSLEFMRLGGIARQSELYHESRVKIRDVATEVGELANLGVPERGYVYVIRMSEVKEAVHDGAPEGKYTPMHTTALGKAMMAHMKDDHVLSIIEQRGLPELTKNTITDRNELLNELETVREQGYAVDAQEGNLGIRCLAAPIADSEGEPLGAISVSGPAERMRQDGHQKDIIKTLTSTANAIEVELEYS